MTISRIKRDEIDIKGQSSRLRRAVHFEMLRSSTGDFWGFIMPSQKGITNHGRFSPIFFWGGSPEKRPVNLAVTETPAACYGNSHANRYAIPKLRGLVLQDFLKLQGFLMNGSVQNDTSLRTCHKKNTPFNKRLHRTSGMMFTKP